MIVGRVKRNWRVRSQGQMESLLLRHAKKGLEIAAGVGHRWLLREHLLRAPVIATYQKQSHCYVNCAEIMMNSSTEYLLPHTESGWSFSWSPMKWVTIKCYIFGKTLQNFYMATWLWRQAPTQRCHKYLSTLTAPSQAWLPGPKYQAFGIEAQNCNYQLSELFSSLPSGSPTA